MSTLIAESLAHYSTDPNGAHIFKEARIIELIPERIMHAILSGDRPTASQFFNLALFFCKFASVSATSDRRQSVIDEIGSSDELVCQLFRNPEFQKVMKIAAAYGPSCAIRNVSLSDFAIKLLTWAKQ